VSPRGFSLITKSEESMSRNKSLESVSKALIVMAMAILVAATGAWGQTTFKTLHEFAGVADGSNPEAGLIFDPAGNLYGTTYQGAGGWGSVFELIPNADGSWTENLIHTFAGGSDGEYPRAGLIFDQAGNLYGTASQGTPNHEGAVFELTPDGNGSWSETVLHSFCSLSNCTDGSQPYAGLILDQEGNLYGTTEGSGPKGGGVAFKLTPNGDGTWSESVLHSFCPYCGDGDGVFAGLIFDQTGNLYGTTFYGGTTGSGIVYKLTPNPNGTWKEKILHAFSGIADGAGPASGVIFDTAGNLYGTTSYSTDSSNAGTVFQLTPNSDGSWKEKVLHRFTGGKDGGSPRGTLTFDAAGNLYGTTYSGGVPPCRNGCGVVFKLTPDSNGMWHETVLHAFIGQPGADPIAGLILDASGNLYGTATGASDGSVFEITP
jgi:uncharacterized repeat protein (TIGR03803 family)